MALPPMTPSGACLHRLDPQQFQQCFTAWIRAVSDLPQGQVIAIDGKTLRRAHDTRVAEAAIPMVNAWAQAHSLVLGQPRVEARSTSLPPSPPAEAAGGVRLYRDHSREGVSAGACQDNHGPGSGLRPGSEA